MSDKYPPESNRRRFVKGVVGGAALAGGGATIGTASVNTLTNQSGQGGGITQFYGVENIDGPAPRAMPQIPVEIDDEGFVRGVFPAPDEDLFPEVETEYVPEWFQYCGVETYPGIQPGGDRNNYFVYAENPPSGMQWQTEVAEPGDRVNVEHFQDYETWGNGIGESGVGKPARVNWRSQDVPPEETLVVELIRSTNVEQMSGESPWLSASTAQGFIAYLNKCTHFCCVPAFKGIPSSAKFEAEDLTYCACHQSVYDPFSIVRKTFVARPRPLDAGGGGGSGGSGGSGGGGH